MAQLRQEVETFNNLQKIDILLVSETHFTNRTYFKIQNYAVYDNKHPDGTAHGGTTIIIRNNIKHYKIQKLNAEFLQATSVNIEDWNGPLFVSTVYCPPKHCANKQGFIDYF